MCSSNSVAIITSKDSGPKYSTSFSAGKIISTNFPGSISTPTYSLGEQKRSIKGLTLPLTYLLPTSKTLLSSNSSLSTFSMKNSIIATLHVENAYTVTTLFPVFDDLLVTKLHFYLLPEFRYATNTFKRPRNYVMKGNNPSSQDRPPSFEEAPYRLGPRSELRSSRFF